MIVLDTFVLSELLRPEPTSAVLRWFEMNAADALFTTAITRAEMLYGARILPPGRRRDALLHEIAEIFSTDLAGRVLPYDEAAADMHAEIAALQRSEGRVISLPDLMIAGIVRSLGATLATRNVRDFTSCGIVLANPWE